MKPPTVFLGEMTNPEVEAFLRGPPDRDRADRLDRAARSARTAADRRPRPERGRPPRRAAGRRPRRAADQLRAVVPARRVHRASCTSGSRRSWRSSRTSARRSRRWASGGSCSSTATTTTRYAIAYACANAADRLPAGVARLPDQLLGRHDAPRRRRSSSARRPASTRTAARRRPCWPSTRTSSTWTRANAEMPPFPEVDEPGRRSTPRSSSRRRARSIARRTRAPGATRARRRAEYGERYLEVVTEATVRLLDDIERTFEAMPPR